MAMVSTISLEGVSGVCLGSIATYTTTEDYRINGSRVFESRCEDGKWTPQAEIVRAGDSKG